MEQEEEIIVVPINNDLERRIAEAFEIFDHAGNKMVDVREVGTIVRALGCCPTEAEVQEMLIATEDPAIPGSVHLIKFLPYIAQMLAEHKYHPASPEQLLDAFHALDVEGKGYLTREQITTLMTQDGEPFTQDELDEMLEIAIDPHTQTVPYEYYINQLMYLPNEEDDIYLLADVVEAAKPPPPAPPRHFSETLQQMQVNL
ncbi:hypothetical protein Trydic_g16050 [Trypoxylus dichotomus]